MISRALSRLLYLANAGRRREFYPTKDRILKRFGAADGYDLQLFRCWGCADCGPHFHGDYCRHSCCGTGVHHGFILDRYRLGGRTFHRPRRIPASWFGDGWGEGPCMDDPVGRWGEKSRIEGRTRGGVERGAVNQRVSRFVAVLLIKIFGPRSNARVLPPLWVWYRWKRRATRWIPTIGRCSQCQDIFCVCGAARKPLLRCACGTNDGIPF